jgi:NAD(P)-dependent dehydrogenase (short-subunit alcohol dehydrogenase family)
MTKESIHNEYLRSLDKDYQPRREGRVAMVLGVDFDHENIGARIFSQLRLRRMNWEPPINAFAYTHKQLDAGQPSDMRREISHTKADTLILCNGETHLNWVEDQEVADIVNTITNSLTSSVLATRQFVRVTADDPWLKYIVYIGSMAHRNVLNASSPYCAAKAGLAHFARCMGWELTPKGYRVFCVHPSNTEDTPMTLATIEGIMNYRNMAYEEAEAYWGSTKVMPGWLQKQDIAEVVEWLITDRAAEFLSGTQIELAGGQR